MDREEKIDLLTEELEALIMSKPETGEQWAEICRLEADIIALGGRV